ncbi:polysaccharide deacetylase family protein [Uliginosibacterium sediminicola]|uniref:Polysaccharide deacetylase family protein n=1 Tax=Uliginosibacterium sediminicola TaxID=2024550 RepID=A0ABU9Z297_9RHOO
MHAQLEHIHHCFPGGRHKALTFSYDDGKIEDRRLVELFNRHGLKASFNLNGAKFGRDHRIDAHELADLYAGHEVAAHSLTHPTLTRCPPELLVQQLFDDRRRLEDLLGRAVRGFAYPNGKHDQRLHALLPALGFAYARTTGATRSFELPQQLFEWQPSCHHNEGLLELGQEFLARDKSQYLDLFYVWGHSFDFERDGNWSLIERFAQQASGHAEIWYASNIEIVDYLACLQRLQFTADCRHVHNPSAQALWLRVDTLQAGERRSAMFEVAGGATLSLF